LQNENGPCPLLAASNCLLLKGLVTLPDRAMRNGVTSLEDITNMLANYALYRQTSRQSTKEEESFHNQFNLNEFMNYIPNFQYGMDVNPKFTLGCQGYEFTAELSVLSDMLGCKLVHGWLIDPIENESTSIAAGSKSYNELMDRAILGKEAELQVSKLQTEIEKLLVQYPRLGDLYASLPDLLDNFPDSVAFIAAREELLHLKRRLDEAQEIATASHLIENFFAETSHQLTIYGLEQLHASFSDKEIGILFRNNHFSTIARNGENLYLLITDLGYANAVNIVWEKLDVVDGDTEFCDSLFKCNTNTSNIQAGSTLTPEQLMLASGQNDADFQLALQLSLHGDSCTIPSLSGQNHSKILSSTVEKESHEQTGPDVRHVSFQGTVVSIPDGPENTRIELGVPVNISSQSEAADRLLAMQLQEIQDGDPISNSGDEASINLARQLQQQEEDRFARLNISRPPQPSSNCSVM
jgi:ubiquitin carboxyl-terminal hydrolase MINDY-1/2